MAGGSASPHKTSLLQPHFLSRQQTRAEELARLRSAITSRMEDETPYVPWQDAPVLLPVMGDSTRRTTPRKAVAESAQYRKYAIARSRFMAVREAKNAEESVKLERMRNLPSLGTALDAKGEETRSGPMIELFGPAPLDFRGATNKPKVKMKETR